jgi:hypothetical protein
MASRTLHRAPHHPGGRDGADAERHSDLHQEHEQRAVQAQRAHARLDHYDHHPSPWHDAPPLDQPTPDHGLDLGW